MLYLDEYLDNSIEEITINNIYNIMINNNLVDVEITEASKLYTAISGYECEEFEWLDELSGFKKELYDLMKSCEINIAWINRKDEELVLWFKNKKERRKI